MPPKASLEVLARRRESEAAADCSDRDESPSTRELGSDEDFLSHLLDQRRIFVARLWSLGLPNFVERPYSVAPPSHARRESAAIELQWAALIDSASTPDNASCERIQSTTHLLYRLNRLISTPQQFQEWIGREQRQIDKHCQSQLPRIKAHGAGLAVESGARHLSRFLSLISELSPNERLKSEESVCGHAVCSRRIDAVEAFGMAEWCIAKARQVVCSDSDPMLADLINRTTIPFPGKWFPQLGAPTMRTAMAAIESVRQCVLASLWGCLPSYDPQTRATHEWESDRTDIRKSMSSERDGLIPLPPRIFLRKLPALEWQGFMGSISPSGTGALLGDLASSASTQSPCSEAEECLRLLDSIRPDNSDPAAFDKVPMDAVRSENNNLKTLAQITPNRWSSLFKLVGTDARKFRHSANEMREIRRVACEVWNGSKSLEELRADLDEKKREDIKKACSKPTVEKITQEILNRCKAHYRQQVGR